MLQHWQILVGWCCAVAGGAIASGCGAQLSRPNRAALVRWHEKWTPIHAGAYPRLAKLRNGTLLATFDQRVQNESTIGLMRSTNGGKTWGEYARAISYPASDDVANAFPLELADGSLVVAFRHHSPERKIYRLEICASQDGGATWQVRSTIVTGAVGLWEPFLIELPDRTVQVYYASEAGIFPDQRIEMRSSRDGGRTWGPATTVARMAASRDGMPGVARLTDGTLFVVFEASDAPPSRFVIRSVRSTDNGKTWSERRELVYRPKNPIASRWAAGAPSVVLARPGQLLVSFQTDEDVAYDRGDSKSDPANADYDYLRHARFKYITSSDGGRTWSDAVVLTTASQVPALWGALYAADRDVIFAASSIGGKVWSRNGSAAPRSK
jgi:hypothetical protein